jgi:long-chain acyl-CoA synthetase
MAVIIPHEVHLRHALKQGAVDGVDPDASLHTLCEYPGVGKFVLENCNAIGKKNGFKPLEILESVVLTSEEWTPESGMVTAAQKLQRKKIHEAFKDEIKVSFCFFSSRVCGADCVSSNLQKVYPY